MPESAKHQSSPFSTGGGGPNFETRVQAAFTVLMLSGRLAPCLPPFPITKIKLQGRYAGFHTDDFIVFAKQPETEIEARLLAQIKHDISITARNGTFAEVIQSTWNDFNGQSFNPGIDALALITGPLSSTDINDVRPILEWARHAESEEEFLTKINTANFSSNAKREKLAAFRAHLKTANSGSDVSDKQLWEFLRAFHLIGYDLDTASGSTLSLLHSLIAQYSNEAAPSLWTRVVDAVQSANQNAGTLTLETLPEDIRTAFSTTSLSSWLSDFNKLKERGNYILGGIRTTIGGVHIPQADKFSELLNLTETSNFVLVSGERGSGKSSLVKEFSDYVGENFPVFCLRTDELNQPHLDNVFSAIGLRGTLLTLEAGFALMPKKYLIIESLEKLLELERTTAFTDLLQLLRKHQGWTVLATCRDYAYQQITFSFLQPYGVDCTTLILEGFSSDQVQNLFEQLAPLQKIAENQNLRPLLKSPFFVDLAYRVLQTGTEFTSQDGEKEFRIAVWRDVIAKEQKRENGMPLKRKKAFIDIAVSRAKQMVYGVPEAGFDSEAIFKLEEDNLICRDSKKGLVNPAHDVLEDWALDQYIDDAYQRHSSKIQDFLDAIGHEPAINRAFRLWLHQKLRCGENVHDFVLSVINTQDIQRYWKDEAIAAILQGDNPDEFLTILKDQLFLNNGELLKRFCFILRIACQIPDQTLEPKGKDDKAVVNNLFFQPHGQGWNAMICFLYENRYFLLGGLTPHITAVLNNWSSLLSLNGNSALPARKAGLLALYLLDPLKDSYRDNAYMEKLLSVIIKTIPEIREEFLMLFNTDVFVSKADKKLPRPRYIRRFCELAFQGIEAAFFCKYDPDTLIRLAYFEWLIEKPKEEKRDDYDRTFGINHYFRIHKNWDGFNLTSETGDFFKYLLRFHPNKGLNFILELLNITGQEYACSDLDTGNLGLSGKLNSLKNEVTIQLNDGAKIQQYSSDRLWCAYRGYSRVPKLLHSALVALENWLIEYLDYSEVDDIHLEWLFDYILRNSNSVMSTAVLASVANAFPTRIGVSALPLLRTSKLYFMDLARTLEEMCHGVVDSKRNDHLETLALYLQLSECKDEVLAAIDLLYATEDQDQQIRFLLHRIDSRKLKTILDYENSRIIFEADLEPDLIDSSQQSLESFQEITRYSKLWSWSQKKIKNQPLEGEYSPTCQQVLSEIKSSYEELKIGVLYSSFSNDAIVLSAAVLIRDFYQELKKDDIQLCSNLIFQIFTDMKNHSGGIRKMSEYAGKAEAVSVLPVLLNLTSNENKKNIIKKNIFNALIHSNLNIRYRMADGIKRYLWDRDPDFVRECIAGVLEHSFFEIDLSNQYNNIFFLEGKSKEVALANLKKREDEFYDKFSPSGAMPDIETITLCTYGFWNLLSPCLMIPEYSSEVNHVKLLSKMLTFVFESEQRRNQHNFTEDQNLRIDHDMQQIFEECLSKHLFCLHTSNFQPFLEQLHAGCEVAPGFIHSLLLTVGVVAEKENKNEIYWQLWKGLSLKVQEIAIEPSKNTSEYNRLIRGMLHVDASWQKTDKEVQYIIDGKDLILEFVRNAGKNPDVFESLASLIYHFPLIFLDPGIHILSKHQREKGGIILLSGVNTVLYLERSIQHFLQLNQTRFLSKSMYDSCLILLDATIETASSKAYYLREKIMRSRKIA
jgi:hypothetical protein